MNKWKSAEEVFLALNTNYRYIVIRNYEGFYKSIILDNHADIDLLCQKGDKKAIVEFLGAKPRLNKEDGIHYCFKIGKELIPLDLRCTGDGYYDKNWENHMLSFRILDSRGFYCMNTEDYFWSLLYHALYHKGEISEEYKQRLKELKPEVKGNLEEALSIYMRKNNYHYTISRDRYLQYHFTKLCDGRIRAYPFYYVKQFLRREKRILYKIFIKKENR